jgi:hypothetical protein
MRRILEWESLRLCFAGGISLLYVASLLLPAFEIRGGSTSGYLKINVREPGYAALSQSCRTCIDTPIPDWDLSFGMMCLGLLANPLIWIGIIGLLAGHAKLVRLCAIGAIIGQLAIAQVFWSDVSACWGYWCWVLCSVSLLLAAAALQVGTRSS